MSFFNWFSSDAEIIDGDQAKNVTDAIKWNESKAQLTFAKLIVVGAMLTFLGLTVVAVIFIFDEQPTRLNTLVDFTTRWFSPVWAIVGGVITYFFPSRK